MVPVWLVGTAIGAAVAWAFFGRSSDSASSGEDEVPPADDTDVDVSGEDEGVSVVVGGSESNDCGVDLPAPTGFDTSFAAMPEAFRVIYEEPMGLQVSDVTWITQESAAMGAEELAEQAECVGYEEAAEALRAKAVEIRSWDVPSSF
jgi:hypothetical protein